MTSDVQPLFSEPTLPNMDKENLDSTTGPRPMITDQIPMKPPNNVSATGVTLLGPSNTVTTCPFCCASIKTATRYTTTTRTHRLAILCSFICCCCCLPYCMTSTRNTDHYCPNCRKFLGTYEK